MLMWRDMVTQQETPLHLCSIWFFFGVHHPLHGLVSSQVGASLNMTTKQQVRLPSRFLRLGKMLAEGGSLKFGKGVSFFSAPKQK